MLDPAEDKHQASNQNSRLGPLDIAIKGENDWVNNHLCCHNLLFYNILSSQKVVLNANYFESINQITNYCARYALLHTYLSSW